MTNSSIFTKPWFVLTIIVVCFAILTPKIFMPLFKQAFGLTKSTSVPLNEYVSGAPRMEQMRRPTNTRSMPQQQQQQQQTTSKSSMLTFVVPMYAVGILVYLIYVLFKIYLKKKDSDKLNDTEKEFLKQVTGIKWNPGSKEFSSLHALSNDENCDQDSNTNTNTTNNNDIDNFIFKMKSNLNQINTSLIQAEKKGDILDDNDIQSLKLQLTNTELQMEHIYKLLDSISKKQQDQQKQEQLNESNDESLLKKRQKNNNNKSKLKKNKKIYRKLKSSSSSSSIKSSQESSYSSDNRECSSDREKFNKIKHD
jgi:hypothetical protein